FKAGYSKTENTRYEDQSVPGGVTYNSIDTGAASGSFLGPITFLDFTSAYPDAADAALRWTARPFAQADVVPRIIPALEGNATAMAAVDTDNDGVISVAEVNAIVFNNTAGNPYGNINAYRVLRTATGAYEVGSEGQSIYIQDTWTLD